MTTLPGIRREHYRTLSHRRAWVLPVVRSHMTYRILSLCNIAHSVELILGRLVPDHWPQELQTRHTIRIAGTENTPAAFNR
jgi:hypothetical protein